jgi:hypothetical protein
MRHLAVIRAAGADIDNELQRRIQARLSDHPNALQELQDLMDERQQLERDVVDFHIQIQRAQERGTVDPRELAVRQRSISARADAIEARFAALDPVVADARREATIELLSEIRGVGGAGLDYQDSPPHLVEAMRFAEAAYPTDWLEAAGRRGPYRVTATTGAGDDATKGSYGDLMRLFELGDLAHGTSEGGGLGQVAAHELGHSVEAALPEIVEAERLLLWDRTATGEIGERSRGNPIQIGNAQMWQDEFRSVYSGRDYSSDDGDDSTSYELLTTAMQDLVGGGHDHLDDDMRQWLLGVLALLGRDAPERPVHEPDGAHTGRADDNPLAGIDLSSLSLEELVELMAQISDADAIARINAELDRRDTADTGADSRAADPLAGVNLRSLTDEDLAMLYHQYVETDGSVVARVEVELERRDREDHADDGFGVGDIEPTPEDDQISDLLAKGHSYLEAYAEVHGMDVEELEAQDRRSVIAAERSPGETLDQAARRLYDQMIYVQMLEAEDAVVGLLNREGTRKGINPLTLFSGPYHVARAYASEELLRWWTEHPRMTFTEFKAQALGRDSDMRLARRIREGYRGGDFG